MSKREPDNYCGCCGRAMWGSDMWCKDCNAHCGPVSSGLPPWERTYGALNHGAACPFEDHGNKT